MGINSTGIYQEINGKAIANRLTAADQPGKHLWVMMMCYRVADPERLALEEAIFDRDNLLNVAGPGCFKCEMEYSRRLARMPCRGSVA